mgnify:CR=1 FL=1
MRWLRLQSSQDQRAPRGAAQEGGWVMTKQQRDHFTDFLLTKGRKNGIVALDRDYDLGTDDVIESCAGLTAKQADACLRAAKKILRTDPRDAEIARLHAALAAARAALRVAAGLCGTAEDAAEIVEAAQERAMKGGG